MAHLHIPLLAGAMLAAAALSGCGASQSDSASRAPQSSAALSASPPTPSPPPASAEKVDLDAISTPIADCGPEAVRRATADMASTVSADPQAICRHLAAVYSGSPQVRVLRSMLATVSIFAGADPQEEPRTLAKLLIITHLRGRDQPDELLGTLAVVRRMVLDTHGKLTLDDLMAFLGSAGPLAHTMTDEGLLALGPMITGDVNG